MAKNEITDVQKAILSALHDDDSAISDIVDVVRWTTSAPDAEAAHLAAREIANLLGRGWIKIYRFYPPYSLADREELLSDVARAVIESPMQWIRPGRGSDRQYVGVGLTKEGRNAYYSALRTSQTTGMKGNRSADERT